MSIESVNLRYIGGNSNKVYNIQLEQAGDLYEVNAQNGRYGGTLTPRKLTKTPVSLEEAKKVYDKKLKEQLAEGYTADGTGTPFAGTDKAGEVSGLMPQLLNPIKEETLEKYLTDDDWMAEEKKDGNHMMAAVNSEGIVIGSNRRGLIISIPSIIEEDCRRLLPEGGAVDGEAIGDVYWTFDLLRAGSLDFRTFGAERRHDALKLLFLETLGKNKMQVVQAFYTTETKRILLRDLLARRAEGIVFKRRDALYTPGRPNSGGDMVKFKFLGSATVLVSEPHKTKRSVQVSVVKDGELVSIGSVTIPPNYVIPSKGALVEVEYLYCFKGGSLFQTVYKGLRTDKTEPDDYSSLKFKADDLDGDS